MDIPALLGRPRGNDSLADRSDQRQTGGATVRVASLDDVIESKVVAARASPPSAARMPSPRGTRRPLLEREHCLGDLDRRGIGDRSGGLLEDEQPRPGISRATASPLPTGKNGSRRPWRTSVGTLIPGRRSRQRGLQLSLENTMPIWLAIWAEGAVLGVRSQIRAAVVRVATASSPRISAGVAANSATASRSVQSGIGCANSRFIVALSWSGRSSSGRPGAAAVQAGGWVAFLAVIMMLNAAVAAFYYLRIVVYMFMRDPSSQASPLRHGRLLWGGLAVATSLTILFGFFPGLILGIIGQAAAAVSG